MDLNTLGVFKLLNKKMDWLNQRQEVVAENIANVDTPKYKPSDLKTFTFKSALGEGHRLAPVLGRAPRWGRFIVLWNWCNVIEGMLVVIGGLPGLFGAPEVIGEACELIAIGWALWLEWYATRLALGVGPLIATSLVLLDVFIGIVLPSIAVALSP